MFEVVCGKSTVKMLEKLDYSISRSSGHISSTYYQAVLKSIVSC